MRERHSLQELEAVRGETPRELLDRTVEALRVAAEADAALCYTAASVDADTLRAVDWSVAGTSTRAGFVRESFEQGFTVSSTTAMGPASWETRFIRFEELARRMPTASAKMQEDTTDAVGVIDQLILPVSHHGRYLGPIVAVRFEGEKPFDARTVSRLRDMVAPLGGRLVTASRLFRARFPEESCDLLVHGSGEVDYASEAARRWLDEPDVIDELRRVVQRVDRGHHNGFDVPFRGARARVVRLERDEQVRYAVHLAPPPPLTIKRTLTEAEREVAALAAAGATANEIAALRGTSVGTVKNQLKGVYTALGVTTRVELVEALSS